MAKKKNETVARKLTVPEAIEYCKNELGITFNIMDEQTASEFLMKHNFFFRLKLYADVCPDRTKSGKYSGLDFGHLVELSTIDMFFRKLILKMTIDLEHYLKVKLVNDCQNNQSDDGYSVVAKFLESHPKTKEAIETGAKMASYGGNGFEKYLERPAVWNFVEMINFYDFISFYAFYYDYFGLKCGYTGHFDSVRRLRNASAHNVCMLCSFSPVPGFHYDVETSFELIQGNFGMSPGTISSCLKVPVLNDFAVMLSVYTKLVSSPQIKEKTLAELEEFFDGRMIVHKDYFEGNLPVKNAYGFARKVLSWYKEK